MHGAYLHDVLHFALVEGPAEFDARLERVHDGSVVAHVRGDLDMATAPMLERVLAGWERRAKLVVDLSECTFVDSAGLRLLTRAAREAEENGGTVALVVVDPGIRRVLEITGLDAALAVHSTVESAL